MSKELKLLLISLGLLVATVLTLYWYQNNECSTIEYQDLNGTHSKYECHQKPPENCWSNYNTEDAAIKACEGK